MTFIHRIFTKYKKQQGYFKSSGFVLNKSKKQDPITQQTLPDLREINYSYDPNGNLASITPPGKPVYSFNYTAVDLENDYTSPTVAGIINPATLRTYNKDEQLELITRPDGQTLDFVYNATTGQLDTLIIPRGTYSYSYNAVTGNLDQITSPDTGTMPRLCLEN